jgi:hypothetical protein
MADMSVDADTIKSMGCTVLAPCSSTDDKQVALDYAKKSHPLNTCLCVQDPGSVAGVLYSVSESLSEGGGV